MATLNPQSLVTLWQIEQYGSFSATAKATGWSQPAISQQANAFGLAVQVLLQVCAT